MTSPIEQIYEAVLSVRQFNRSLSVDRLRDILIYDPLSGVLTWRVRTIDTHGDKVFNAKYAGHTAGCETAGEVVVNIRLEGKQIGFRAHHLAWALQTGKWPKGIVDHRNGRCHDNRWLNLREATSSGNSANRHVVRGASRFKGVAPFENRWSASVTHNSKQHWIGVFDFEEDAAEAYDRLCSQLHGEYAKTNAQLGLL